MTIPHEYGAFSGRASGNVFTITDFNPEHPTEHPIQKLAEVTSKATSAKKSDTSGVNRTSCWDITSAALTLIGLVASGALLALGVSSGIPFVLAIVIVAILSVLCVCHLAHVIKSSSLCTRNDVMI